MDLQALRQKQSHLVVEFDGETLTLTYNPHKWDDKCQATVNKMSDDEDNTALCAIFEQLVTSWDLRDNGVDIPCDYSSFMMLPAFLRTKILRVMIDDIQERGKLRGSDSSSNRRVARAGLVPIGTSASSTQNGQE